MRKFSDHAKHCRQCQDPYNVWKTDGELCDKGHAYARDVAKYIYSKGGRPHSLIDKDARDERNEIEVPVDCEVIRNLTQAFHKGLNLRAKKAVISHDRNYYVSDRQPTRPREEKRYYDTTRGYGVEVIPGQRRERERYTREEREARDRRRSTVHFDNSKGSLYHLDEQASKSQRRYQDEPVMIIAEPHGRRRYVR